MIRDGQHIGTRNADGMNEDDIITMMVGRELTALYPSEAHSCGEEILRVENLTAWHPVNRHIKRRAGRRGPYRSGPVPVRRLAGPLAGKNLY